MKIIQIHNWGFNIPNQRPILISGPCSAENEEQVMQSCLGAAKQGATILRAGIWKPRTRPDSFEGVGDIGLPWIKTAGKLTKLPVTIEVANTKHVELALKSGIDILWIGARTSVNPFMVQEIAEALRGVDIPLLIKNPVNPDLELWIGAIERLYKAGINKIAAIHRGFSVYKPKPYRNLPMWEIPIELRRRIPDIEIICDPSHICGKRAFLQDISQKALDLEFDGLMIESHINPDQALSDSAQQLTPDDLGILLKNLIRRKPVGDNPNFLANIEALRLDIDNIDSEVLELIAKRMEVVHEIGKYKKENGVTILQMNRWTEIFDSRVMKTIEAGLSKEFAHAFIQCIHNESIRKQTELMSSELSVNKT